MLVCPLQSPSGGLRLSAHEAGMARFPKASMALVYWIENDTCEPKRVRSEGDSPTAKCAVSLPVQRTLHLPLCSPPAPEATGWAITPERPSEFISHQVLALHTDSSKDPSNDPPLSGHTACSLLIVLSQQRLSALQCGFLSPHD